MGPEGSMWGGGGGFLPVLREKTTAHDPGACDQGDHLSWLAPGVWVSLRVEVSGSPKCHGLDSLLYGRPDQDRPAGSLSLPVLTFRPSKLLFTLPGRETQLVSQPV